MLIENNTLIRIDQEDVIDGVFVAPDDVWHIVDNISCSDVKKIILPEVKTIGNNFLYNNKTLEHLECPKIKNIGNYFLCYNNILGHLECPKIKNIGNYFLCYNNILGHLEFPMIEQIGDYFLYHHQNLKYTPNIIKALQFDMYIDGKYVDKKVYLRKINLNKLLNEN